MTENTNTQTIQEDLNARAPKHTRAIPNQASNDSCPHDLVNPGPESLRHPHLDTAMFLELLRDSAHLPQTIRLQSLLVVVLLDGVLSFGDRRENVYCKLRNLTVPHEVTHLLEFGRQLDVVLLAELAHPIASLIVTPYVLNNRMRHARNA